MSYLDRLKRKISANAPEAEATKVSKGAFVPFVATPAAPFQQISPAGVDLEAFEERPAIMEYEGGLVRAEAETRALNLQRNRNGN